MSDEQENPAEEQRETAETKAPVDNLKDHQWPKGQSGNPNGRPPGIKTMWKRLQDHMEEPIPETLHRLAKTVYGLTARQPIPLEVLNSLRKLTYGDLFIKSVTFDAIVGRDLDARRLIFDRLDGRLPQRIEGSGGRPLIPGDGSNVLVINVTSHGLCDLGEDCLGCEHCDNQWIRAARKVEGE